MDVEYSEFLLKFGTLFPGKCFFMDEKIYMKTDMVYKDLPKAAKLLQGINLLTGELVIIEDETYVKPVNAKVVIYK